jgi:predicted ATP-dependent protease
VIVPHSNAAEVRADVEVIPVKRIEDFVAALLP